MVQTLFNADQPLAKYTMVTYNLQPSQQLVNIRSVLASRKRKSNIGSKTDIGKIQKHVFNDIYSGLPSPPVESSLDSLGDFSTVSAKCKSNHSPPLTPNTTFSSCSSVTTETNNNDNNNVCPMEVTEDDQLSTKDIESKLTALREEKHNMFQLLKRLVEQEEQQQQQKYQAEEEHRHQVVVGIQSMDHQQQQPDLKKKKTSRWASPSSYQRPSPLPRHQAINNNYTTTNTEIPRHTSASTSSSFHTHARPQVYLGGPRQLALTCPQQQQPYFY